MARPELWEEAKASGAGLGLFVRGLVGMDREATKQALNTFTSAKALTGNQIEFVNLVVDHLTTHGAVPPALLYESPFTDVNPRGPGGVFESRQVDELVAVLGGNSRPGDCVTGRVARALMAISPSSWTISTDHTDGHR